MIEKNPFYEPVADFGQALFSDPMLAFAAALLLLLLFALRKRSPGKRRHGHTKTGPQGVILPFGKTAPARSQPDRASLHLPENQVRAIADAQFETQPLLNRSEARLLPVIEDVLAGMGRGHRVMAQTSLGELLRPSKDQPEAIRHAAHAAINSKRFDFAIIDRAGRLVAAVEYQGTGHYRDTAFIRDAIKREACRKAGVAFIEVQADAPPADLVHRLRQVLDPSPKDPAGRARAPRAPQPSDAAAS